MFVDEATIEVKGGDGGNGIVAFRREKYVPDGGPSGGDGGNGGSVVLRADSHQRTLFELARRRHHRAEKGRHGEGSRRNGRQGQGITLRVPVGTQIFDADDGQLLGDLTLHGQEFTAARGGSGGRGNVHFSTSSRQAPRFAELGAAGQERTLRLSLKLLADVALIGLPNAGKSTLVSSISASKAKIADYPFTTLVPNLGVVRLDANRVFTAADIPGLIRGASRGAGLGHQFLKHVERAPVFVHLVDPLAPQPFRHFLAINRELRQWNSELLERPQLIALTKSDLWDEETRPAVAALKARFELQGCEVFDISAATRSGLEPLLARAMELVEIEREARAAQTDQVPVVVTQTPVDAPLAVREIARYADGQSEWEVEGGPLARLAGRFDLDNPEAALYVHRILERSGVLEQMRNAGVKIGDLVHVGDLAMEWKE